MPATLTLQFDDEASPAFETLVKNIARSGDASNELQGELDKLREELDALKASGEHAAESQSSLNSEVHETAVVVEESGRAMERTLAVMGFLGRNAFELAKTYAEYRLAKQRMTAAHDAFNFAARGTIGYVTGLGTGVTGAYVAYKSLIGIMSSTGRVFLDIETGAEATSDAFRKMQNEARELGISVEKHIRNSGQTLEDFGVRVESNLNRQVDAVSKLAKESARPFMDFGRYFKAGVVDPVVEFTEGQWKEFDRQMTLRAGFFVENVGMMTTLVREFQAATVEAQGGSGEAYKREIELLEKQYEITEKLKKQNADNRDDFARARAINEAVENAISAEELQLRLRNANVEQIREEVQQTKEMMGKLAQQGRLDEELAKDMEGRLVWLAKRERELIAETAKARNDALLKTFEAQQRYAEEQDRKARQSVSDEMRQYQQDREDRRRADEQASKERMREIEAEVRERIQGQQRIREELRKTQEEERRNREQRIKELAGQMGGGMSGKDARQQAVEIERNTLQQIGQLRQQATQSFVTGDVRGFFEARQKEHELLQEALQKQKQLREKFGKEGTVLDKIKGQFGDKDILNQVTENRFQEAGKGLIEKNRDAFDAFRKQKAGGSLSEDEQRLSRQFQRDAEKLQRDIARQTNRDARGGRIGEEETTKATNTLVNRTIDAAQKQGKLGDDAVQGLRQAAEANQALADKSQQQSKEIEEINQKLADVVEQVRNDTGSGTARAKRGAR